LDKGIFMDESFQDMQVKLDLEIECRLSRTDYLKMHNFHISEVQILSLELKEEEE
jgi:hypothetical protein